MSFGDIPVDAFLTSLERQIWHGYNDTALAFLSEPSLIGWLERIAQTYPSRPAVSAEDGELSYAELHQRADAVAKLLVAHGVQPGTAVAVAAVRRCCAYVGLLGALKAGCFYVPIDPQQPRDRLDTIFGSAGIAAVLSDADSTIRLNAVGAAELCRIVVEDDAAVPGWHTRREAESLPALVRTPPSEDATERLCYMIYTSGTTGTPKGVRISESNVINFVNWYVQRHAVEATDRLSQNAPLTFDPSVQQIFSAWSAGACLVVVPETIRRDAHDFLSWLRRERISHLDIVTAHWIHLLGAVAQESIACELPALRWIVVAGESIYYHQTHQWYTLIQSPCRINNIYGPTEATINATQFEVPPDCTTGKVPIGTPLPNYRIYILDDAGELCPPGVVGEICIAGAGVALGYSDAEATEHAFAEISFEDGRRERIYRSGDLGTLAVLPSGTWTLEFRGRVDRQVKISGYRVELEEIEVVAESCSGVNDAVVLIKNSPAQQLVCFFSGAEGNADRLREYLAERLPAYMVPHLVVAVEQMPVGRNGKVDSEALLRLLERREQRTAEGCAELATATERLIAEVWSELLDTSIVSADAEFFSLGGSSLLAFRAVTLLRRHHLDVRGADLLSGATIRSLARLADRRSTAVTIDRASDQPEPQAAGSAACSTIVSWIRDKDTVRERLRAFAQPTAVTSTELPPIGPLTALWLDSRSTVTTGTALLDLQLSSAYRTADIVRAVAELIQRHPLLRCRRGERATAPSLNILAIQQLDVPVVDLTELSPAEVNDVISQIRQTINASCAAWTGLAASAAVLIEPGATHRLLLGAPHVLLDGASIQQLALEIAQTLDRSRNTRPQPDASTMIRAWQQPNADEHAILDVVERYLQEYAQAEAESARWLAERCTSTSPLVEVFGWAIPEVFVRRSGHGLVATFAAVLAQAMYATFGLRAVAISRAHHGRDHMDHADAFAVIANLMDYHPLLVHANSDLTETYASAQAAVTFATTPPRHWMVLIHRHLDQLAPLWTGAGLPFVASIRLSLGSGVDREIAAGIRALESPTESSEVSERSVELVVRPQDDGWVVDIVAIGIDQSLVDALAQACRRAAEQLATMLMQATPDHS